MFEKMYVDEPDNWQPVDEAKVKHDLGGYYKDVDEVVIYLFNGGIARTPWAYYRYTQAIKVQS